MYPRRGAGFATWRGRRNTWRPFRRSRVRKTTYQRRRYSRRPRPTRRMTTKLNRRAILNASTIKKRDTMKAWTNTLGGQEVPGGATFTQAGLNHCIVWSPTCRGSTTSGGVRQTKFYEQTRTSALTYCVGVAETIRISTSGPGGWFWRRICFTAKGDEMYSEDRRVFTLSNSPVARITSDGVQRACLVSDNVMRIREFIFRGRQQVDWFDVMTAPIDNNNVRPLYDKRTHIKSNNSAGHTTIRRLYHKMGHNLRYDEEEDGESMTEAYYAVEGRIGMGDYYIVDFFVADHEAEDTTPTPTLRFVPEATYYWHER